jgi:hypothetical protein
VGTRKAFLEEERESLNGQTIIPFPMFAGYRAYNWPNGVGAGQTIAYLGLPNPILIPGGMTQTQVESKKMINNISYAAAVDGTLCKELNMLAKRTNSSLLLFETDVEFRIERLYVTARYSPRAALFAIRKCAGWQEIFDPGISFSADEFTQRKVSDSEILDGFQNKKMHAYLKKELSGLPKLLLFRKFDVDQ